MRTSGFPGVIGPGTYVAGATITDNGWHLIEMQWDTSSATVWTADWRVDLVAQPRASWNTTSLGLSPGGTTDAIAFGPERPPTRRRTRSTWTT